MILLSLLPSKIYISNQSSTGPRIRTVVCRLVIRTKNMNSLKGIFDNHKPPSKRNFIQENVKQLRSMQKTWNNKERNVGVQQKSNKLPHATAKVPAYVTSSTASKQSDVPSSQTMERAKTSYASTRVSNRSCGLRMQVRNDGRQRSKSAQLSVSRYLPAQSSQICSDSAGKHSSVLERDFSDKASKTNIKLSSQNDVVSTTNPLQTMSFSRCAMDENEQCLPVGKSDTSWYDISENHISVQPTRSVGCQTVSPEDIDGMFNEGVIKYPSTYNIGILRTEHDYKTPSRPTCNSSQQTDSSFMEETSQDLKSTRLGRKSTEETNGVQRSHQIAQPVHERLLQRFRGISTGGQKSHSVNGLPRKCISPRKGRNKEKVRNESKNKSLDIDKKSAQPPETPDPACPLGHVPLPEPERVETLRMLRKSYEDHIRELNCLPVKTDTLKMRQRKIDLEKQLSKLEEGIKVFSRPKVFVKIGV